jgi:hypothetical protein
MRKATGRRRTVAGRSLVSREHSTQPGSLTRRPSLHFYPEAGLGPLTQSMVVRMSATRSATTPLRAGGRRACEKIDSWRGGRDSNPPADPVNPRKRGS